MSNITISMDTSTILQVEELAKLRNSTKSGIIQAATVFYMKFITAEYSEQVLESYENMDRILKRKGWTVEHNIEAPKKNV